MPFNNRKSMPTTAVKASSSSYRLKKLFLIAFPLVVACGGVVRWHVGELGISSLQAVSSHLYVPCIFHWLTEWDCPGCGITRSLISMYLWSPRLSFYFHPLGPVIFLSAAFYWASHFSRRAENCWRHGREFFRTHAYTVLIVVAAWGVLRNF